MVFATKFGEYEDYFRKAHKIIYGTEADENYAFLWARDVWERQEKGAEINLPSLKELRKMKTVKEKVRAINKGAFGGKTYANKNGRKRKKEPDYYYEYAF